MTDQEIRDLRLLRLAKGLQEYVSEVPDNRYVNFLYKIIKMRLLLVQNHEERIASVQPMERSELEEYFDTFGQIASSLLREKKPPSIMKKERIFNKIQKYIWNILLVTFFAFIIGRVVIHFRSGGPKNFI